MPDYPAVKKYCVLKRMFRALGDRITIEYQMDKICYFNLHITY